MKILVVVASAGFDPWFRIEEEGQKSTFADVVPTNATVLWLQGRKSLDKSPLFIALEWLMEGQFKRFQPHDRLRGIAGILTRVWSQFLNFTCRAIFGNVHQVPTRMLGDGRVEFGVPTRYFLHTFRVLAYLDFCLRTQDFDFLLKTTSTCYIHWQSLTRELDRLPAKGIYAGEMYSKSGVRFVSGAGTLMSRDVVEALIENQRQLRLDVYEDVAFGDLIQNLNLAVPASHPRMDISEWPSPATNNSCAKEGHPYVIRCKTSAGVTSQAEPVVEILKSVHAFYSSNA